MGIIKGSKIVYLDENPLWDVDHPIGDLRMSLNK
jgi:hypothetical protein